MIDREKVKYDIERCICHVPDACRDCSHYKHGEYLDCMEELLKAALALLEEQEPLEPIYNEEKYGDHLPHCGNCEKVLPDNAVYGKVNFCHYCGKAVKWDA